MREGDNTHVRAIGRDGARCPLSRLHKNGLKEDAHLYIGSKVVKDSPACSGATCPVDPLRKEWTQLDGVKLGAAGWASSGGRLLLSALKS